ncbi:MULTISPECIES: hypothetical protein [unclassified Sphingobium]|uniref:hypothetical protein n=1 Tax=unclassified Sphingobium TaxID=2611147 RepID=UPI0035A5FB72
MQIPLSSQGNPELPFLTACATRTVDFAGAEDEAHPLQLVPARWRAFSILFTEFVDELADVEAEFKPDGTALIAIFRRVVYEATELFDCYTNLLPSRINPCSKGERQALKEFRNVGQRLRSFTANLCNRCKHASAQLQFLWAQSSTNGRVSARLLVQVYKGGNALLRDDKVHRGKMAGLGLVRIGHELAHNLLRIDCAAARLMNVMEDRVVEPMAAVSAEIPIGAALRRLSTLEATRHSDESANHYGLVFRADTIELVRVTAVDLGPNVRMTVTLTHHLPTTSYSVA